MSHLENVLAFIYFFILWMYIKKNPNHIFKGQLSQELRNLFRNEKKKSLVLPKRGGDAHAA